MAQFTPVSVQPATDAEISKLLNAAERELGIVLTPITEKSILLSNAERSKLHHQLERRGISVSEVKAGQDLGYIARACDLDGQTPLRSECVDPGDATRFAGQRFTYHALNALEYNLRCANRLSVPKHLIAENASNLFYMGRTPTELGTRDPITKYAREGLVEKLMKQGITITEKMKQLDSKPLLVAVDLEGYKTLGNRLGIPFLKSSDAWCLIAACPPPRKFIHILGEIHEDGLPNAD